MDERYGRRYEDDERRSGEAAPREYEGRRHAGESSHGGYYQPARSRGISEHGSGWRERGFLDRARDEVKSWFGDDDAEQRRREDERLARRRAAAARGEGAARGAREWDGPPAPVRRERDDVDDQRTGSLADQWRGPYVGRGPKGYQRPDERVREDVCDLLCAHGGVDASDVEVQVAACEVTLLGTIATRSQKRLAEDLASTGGGVKDVHNQLRVIQPEPWPGSTDWRSRAA
jgi:osmotically-inducible protein OsmY